jgi:pimeloyl-ACP methyl ester carboxylesterase
VTAILWLHGYPLSSSVFEPQRAIAAHHLIPDLPGFGGAPPPPDHWTMDDYARFALSVLDAEGIQKAVVAGLSMGGYVGLALFRLAPERVRGLILIDTRETADSEEARKGRHEAAESVRREGTEGVIDAMLPKMLTAEAPAELRREVRAMMGRASAEGIVIALRAMAGRPDSTPLLPEIRVPVLIAAGQDDPITPPSDAERMAAAIEASTLVIIPEAAHLSNLEQPAVFNGAVERWLSRLATN